MAQTLDANFGAKSGFNNQNIDNGASFFVSDGIAGTLTASYGTKWNGNASANNGSLFVMATGQANAEMPNSVVPALNCDHEQPIIFDSRQSISQGGTADGLAQTLNTDAGRQAIASGSRIRRITPIEAERLQGFPDDWTDVPIKGRKAADTPRYKAIGNSMAVPVMRWIGERIDQVNKIYEKEKQS